MSNGPGGDELWWEGPADSAGDRIGYGRGQGVRVESVGWPAAVLGAGGDLSRPGEAPSGSGGGHCPGSGGGGGGESEHAEAGQVDRGGE